MRIEERRKKLKNAYQHQQQADKEVANTKKAASISTKSGDLEIIISPSTSQISICSATWISDEAVKELRDILIELFPLKEGDDED